MVDKPDWQCPIREGCFMVGHRNPNSLLQCNTYLRRFSTKGGKPAYWVVDPGSQVDYPHVRSHLLEHVGELAALSFFSINHQDPDVVGNLTFLTRENTDLVGLATEDTWRLVRHLNVHPKKMYFTNKATQNLVKLPGGQDIEVLPTPFCHFRGAVCYYDPETQILFSGDLFGGLNRPSRVQLYGEEADWPGIAQFHQIYMPSNAALAYAIRQVRGLKPAVQVIAPQHGFVLVGDFMHSVMDRLEKLPVGLDLLPSELDERYVTSYNEVLQDVIHLASMELGRDAVIVELQRLPSDHDLKKHLEIKGRDIRLLNHGITALPLVVEELGRNRHQGFVSLLKSTTLEGCSKRHAPLPQMGVGIEGE
jgi:glyoxylase-like metal-dependent hydrolase (beta-lactamase superfamily II)